MIIRKPYAFLIKNFRKVHAFLLIVGLYVFIKLLDVSNFVNEFMSLGAYDYFNNPITKHITVFLYLAIGVLIIGTFALLLLLQRKGKPWKIYLIPFIEYIALIFVLGMINSFFSHYNNTIATTDLRLSRDLLVMAIILNLAAIAIYGMRVLGMDLNKFNFTSDQEFLELSEDDREEIELRVKFDKNIFLRFFRRIARNLNYFYLEHKLICNAIFTIIGVVILFNLFKFAFVTNRTYSEGDFYSANGYTIKINKSYFTDKDCAGNVISKRSNFIVVDLTIENKAAPRTVNLENFHLKNGVSDYTTTDKTYEKEFADFGSAYDSVKELKRDETSNIIIIFKVDKDLKINNFALFYQENGGILRKIKLDVTDISKIKDVGEFKLEDEIDLDIKPKAEKISFDKYEITKSTPYSVRYCGSDTCRVEKETYIAEAGYSVLKIEFSSLNFEGKDMVDFLADYGKIVYIDNSKMEHSVEFKYPIKKKALGKTVFTRVPEDISQAQEIKIVLNVRDKKYTYKLK